MSKIDDLLAAEAKAVEEAELTSDPDAPLREEVVRVDLERLPVLGLRAREVARPSDADAMRRLAAGEMSALGELYDRHHESVRRFIARDTSDAEDVDDLVHTAFLAAAKSAGSYDGRASCRPAATSWTRPSPPTRAPRCGPTATGRCRRPPWSRSRGTANGR